MALWRHLGGTLAAFWGHHSSTPAVPALLQQYSRGLLAARWGHSLLCLGAHRCVAVTQSIENMQAPQQMVCDKRHTHVARAADHEGNALAPSMVVHHGQTPASADMVAVAVPDE